MSAPNLFRDVYPFTSPPRIKLRDKLGVKPVLTDTTLRDGQQGWRALTVEEGLRLYDVIHVMGGDSGAIKTTEVFLYTDRDKMLVREILERGYHAPKPIGWVRASRNDLALAIEAGLDEVTMLTSISDYHIYFKLGLDREKAVSKYLSVVEEAMKKGVVVKSTLEDVTRADIDAVVIPYLKKLMLLAEKYGMPVKVKLADTLGVGLPFWEAELPRSVPKLVKKVIEEAGVPGEWIEFHGHNDLGLVVANHLAAWLAGASMSNCTLFGIGERAGNCPLEVMLVHYVSLTGDDSVNLKAVVKAANMVREMGFHLPEFYPLVGENAFRTKAGIHVDGLLKNPEVYLPFDPREVLGVPFTVSITPYSGRAAIALWLQSRIPSLAGISKDHPAVKAIYDEIVKMFDSTGRTMPLNDREMWALAKKYLSEELEERAINEVETKVGA